MMAEVRSRFKLTDFLYVFNGWNRNIWKLNYYKDQNEQLNDLKYYKTLNEVGVKCRNTNLNLVWPSQFWLH